MANPHSGFFILPVSPIFGKRTRTMRYFLLLLLFLPALPLLAEDPINTETRYVWAKSGLTIRATDSPAGAKVTVIPYGAKVKVTPRWSEVHTITALSGWRQGEVKSLPYKMEGQYLEVQYGNFAGYAYSPYLLPYEAPKILSESDGELSQKSVERIEEWQERLFGQPDTVYCNVEGHIYPVRCLRQFPNGMIHRWQEQEGGGSSERIIPDLNLAQGFVLYDTFFGYSKPPENEEEKRERMALVKVTENTLEFLYEDGYFSNDEIIQIGAFLIFRSEGGC